MTKTWWMPGRRVAEVVGEGVGWLGAVVDDEVVVPDEQAVASEATTPTRAIAGRAPSGCQLRRPWLTDHEGLAMECFLLDRVTLNHCRGSWRPEVPAFGRVARHPLGGPIHSGWFTEIPEASREDCC